VRFDGALETPRSCVLESLDELGLNFVGIHVGHDANTHPGPCRLAHDVARVFARARLYRIDRDRWLPPVGLPRVPPASEDLHTGKQARLLAEVSLVARKGHDALPLRLGERADLVGDAGDGDRSIGVRE